MRDLLKPLRANWVQIALVLAVFVILMVNATGAFEVLFEIQDATTTLPAVAKTREFIVLALIGGVLSVLLPVLNPVRASLLTFVCMLPVFYMGFQIQPQRPLIPFEFSLLTILLLYVVNVLFSYFSETKKKQRLIEVFGQYIPAELAAEISRDPDHSSMLAEARCA